MSRDESCPGTSIAYRIEPSAMCKYAADFALVAFCLSVAGVFVEWHFLDSARVELMGLALLVLLSSIRRGNRLALFAGLVLVLASAAADLALLHTLVFDPGAIRVNGHAMPRGAQVGMSICLTLKAAWAFITSVPLGCCWIAHSVHPRVT